mgnify:FL=1|tara:strand:+ start:5877 stop:6128 length:252 start_codon:yes stop_codon:yes gene_type:complete
MTKYRIVRVENHLTGKTQFQIERQKQWLWMTSWTTELGLDISQNGPVGASYYDGALYKLNKIKVNNGQLIRRGVVDKPNKGNI